MLSTYTILTQTTFKSNLIFRTPRSVSGFLPKCYKTHTCTDRQRYRGGRREAREGGVHRCRQNVIKRTCAPEGRNRRGRWREASEGGLHRHKLNVGMYVNTGYGYASRATRFNS